MKQYIISQALSHYENVMLCIINLVANNDISKPSTVPDKYIVHVIGVNNIYQSDVDRLLPEKFLNNPIVSSFMHISNDCNFQFFFARGRQEAILCCNLLLILLLMGDNDGYNFNKVCIKSLHVPGRNIFSLLCLFFPVYISPNHCALLVAHIPDKKIKYYDSMENNGS